jgi:hypothetical protein
VGTVARNDRAHRGARARWQVSDEQEKPFQMPDTTATEKAPDVSDATLSLLDVAFEFEPGKWTLAEIMHKLDCIDGVL